MSPHFGRWMGPFFREIMTALYDVGQQKTVTRGAGLSLTKTFLSLTIGVLTDFVGRRGIDCTAC
ncbi:hypothetical protein [Burkholderia pyrrocinia]|uniref:hypothetical protein n=1 Tax=Burkholderia pyrrocinia TaxID=60550 RepID=UPI0013752311|nr:hypothetical protein [Burkholderia pyrrocinia]